MDTNHQRVTATAIWLLAVLGGCLVAVSAYQKTRSLHLETIFEDNLRLASALSDHATEPDGRSTALDRVEQAWNALPDRAPGSFLCVISETGELRRNTLRPEKIGTYVGDVPISDDEGETQNVQGLLNSHESWVGLNRNHAGGEQLAAYYYSQPLHSLVAVHVPKQVIDDRLSATTLPWLLGFGSLLLVLLPIALGLLHHAHTTVQRQSETRALELDEARRLLEASEERFRDLYENAPDMFLSVNVTTGQVVSCNNALARTLGLSSEKIVGSSVFDFYGPDSREVAKRAFERFKSTGEIRGVELALRKHDGSLVNVLLNASAVRNDEGKIVCSRSILRDITELRAATTEKERLRHQLLQSQKLESIGTMAAGLAHDFNNVLTAILGNCEILKEECKCPGAGEYVDGAILAAEQARGLANKTLMLARGQVECFEPVSVRETVDEALRMLRVSAPPGVTLDFEDSGEAGIVLGDRAQLHQVINNLVTNAFYASKERGGAVVITAASAPAVRQDTSETSVILTVTDSGCGIDPKILERVTEPFVTTKPDGDGTGLGLSVVKDIVETHHGQLTIESQLGQGTVVTIELPRIDETLRTISLQSRGSGMGKGRILLVEDDQLVSDLIVTQLRRRGFLVDAYRKPEDALADFASGKTTPDLVLTDYSMPNLNGVELAKQLREIKSDIPIVLLTGSPSRVSEQDRQCVDGFLKKPFREGELFVAVSRSISHPTDAGSIAST